MINLKAKILKAARADSIPKGESGLWTVEKAYHKTNKPETWHGKEVMLPADIYTHLLRVTTEKLHLWPPGDIVMEDTPFEMNTHLNFMLKAY